MQEMHGYQLNELIDSHLGTSIHLKKPTAYRLLNQMTDDGWITFREEREGNRPPRRVYAITPNGEAAFQRLLRKSLADYKAVDFVGNIGLLFLDVLPAEETASLLQDRRTIVADLLQETQTHAGHHGGFQLVLEHQTRHLATELEWLDEVITRIESS
jgi:DNA-binding PadR family transcriptional regulator